MTQVAARPGAPPDRSLRDLVTPEGMPIRFRLAPLGTRVAAFLFDSMIQAFVLTLLVCGAGMVELTVGENLGVVVIAIGAFCLRNFYFLGFELGSRAATPGKRVLGVRVIDARGGPLTAQAIFARNLTRELEFFIPLGLLIAPAALFPGASVLMRIVALVWVGVLVAMPWITRDRQRVGDLVGGTLVVVAPKAVLARDVTEQRRRQGPRQSTEASYHFTREQLAHYGIYELQVLEELLRTRRAAGDFVTELAVLRKIQRKIGWPKRDKDVDVRRFLHDFYVAQRAELERRMEFGERKEHKNA